MYQAQNIVNEMEMDHIQFNMFSTLYTFSLHMKLQFILMGETHFHFHKTQNEGSNKMTTKEEI